MSGTKTTRRGFLATTSGAAAALATTAAVSRAAPGANDRLSIGMIGVGGRGTSLMESVLKLSETHNVDVTALCDVWQVNLNQAAEIVKKASGKPPRTFTRFGELLALDDVDAVMIATPDFGHTPIMIEALKAGKDVYVEKPMAMEISLADQALKLARDKKAVVQVGTQRRSEGKWKAAGKAVADGVVGKVTRVSAGVYFNQDRWKRNYDDCKEKDVDWDAYLFNRPKRSFDPKLLRRWHLYYLCTNGLSGLWMSHYVDALNIVMGSTYPKSAYAHGGTYYWPERETEDVFHALIDYPEGFLFEWGMGLTNGSGGGFNVCGRKGTLNVETLTLSGSGMPTDNQILGKRVGDVPPNQHHQANWIECIRSRNKPNADIEYGHQHSVATILAAVAMKTGERQTYTPPK
jgi:predicted dehydrogenase